MHLDNLITSESKQENKKQTTKTNKQKRGQDWRGKEQVKFLVVSFNNNPPTNGEFERKFGES